MEKQIKDRLNALKSKLSDHNHPKMGKSKSSIESDYQRELMIRIDELERLTKHSRATTKAPTGEVARKIVEYFNRDVVKWDSLMYQQKEKVIELLNNQSPTSGKEVTVIIDGVEYTAVIK